MAAGSGRQVTGRSQIRVVEQFAFRLLFLDSGGGLRKREHIEVGGDAEDERLFEAGFLDGVRVRVDQTWQERLPGTIDNIRAGWRSDVPADRANHAIFDQDACVVENAGSIEYAYVIDQQRLGCRLGAREARANRAGEQK